MDMQYSKAGYAMTEYFEGCKLEAYQDSNGKWTLGYGHTIGVKEGDTCTHDQAVAWLMSDIQYAVAEVNRDVHVTITQGEFDALVDFVFNLGVGNFEKSTLLKLVNEGNFQGSMDQIPLWSKCGGQVLAGLLRRRMGEVQMAKTGEYNVQ